MNCHAVRSDVTEWMLREMCLCNEIVQHKPSFSISLIFFLFMFLRIYSRFLEGRSSVTKECTVVVFLSKQQTLLY